MQVSIEFDVPQKVRRVKLDDVFKNMTIRIKAPHLKYIRGHIIVKRFNGTDEYWTPIDLNKMKIKKYTE